MANYQLHYFTSQDSGVLQVYSVLITRDTIQFLKFSKTDQSGEGSTIVILELPPPPPTMNRQFYNRLSKAVYVQHLQSPLAAFESLQLYCYYIVSSETHG